MNQGWIAAFREAWHSPLLELWQRQDSRRSTRGFWLSSPGLLLLATPLVILLYWLLVRQLGILAHAAGNEGMNPILASAVFWLAINASIKYLVLIVTFICCARLYRVLADSGSLLDGRSGKRAQLDNAMAVSMLDDRHLVAAQHISNFRLLYPWIVLLSLLLGLHRVVCAFGHAAVEAPDAIGLAVRLVLHPLWSSLLAAVALLILGNFAIAAGSAAAASRLFLIGVAGMSVCQFGVAATLYYFATDNFIGIDDCLVMLPALTGLLPGLLLVFVAGFASRSAGLLRIFSSGLGMIPLAGIALAGLLCDRMFMLSFSDQNIESGLCVFQACVNLQAISVLPVLPDTLEFMGLVGNPYGSPDAVFPGMMLSFLVGMQLLLLRVSSHFATSCLAERRARQESANESPRSTASKARKQSGNPQRVDAVFAVLLVGIPLLLTMATMISARLIRPPLLESKDPFEQWFLDCFQRGQSQAAWTSGLRNGTMSLRMSEVLGQDYSYTDDLIDQSIHYLMQDAAVRLETGNPGDVDPRLARLCFIAYETNHSVAYPQLTEEWNKLYEQYPCLQHDPQAIAIIAEIRLQKLGWEDFAPAYMNTRPAFSSDPKSAFYSRDWMPEDDYQALKQLYASIDDSLADNAFPYHLEVCRRLANDDLNGAMEVIRGSSKAQLADTRLNLLAALALDEPEKFDPLSRYCLYWPGFNRIQSMNNQYFSDFFSASRQLCKESRTDDLQLLHDYILRFSKLLGPYDANEIHRAMLQGIPANYIGIESNRAFKDAKSAANSLQYSEALYGPSPSIIYGNNHTVGIQLLEGHLAFTRPHPDSVAMYTYFLGLNDEKLVLEAMTQAEQREYESIISLDWTALDCSPAADSTDSAEEAGESQSP